MSSPINNSVELPIYETALIEFIELRIREGDSIKEISEILKISMEQVIFRLKPERRAKT